MMSEEIVMDEEIMKKWMNDEWMGQMSSKKENSGLLLLVTLLTSCYHLASIMSQLRCTGGEVPFPGKRRWNKEEELLSIF